MPRMTNTNSVSVLDSADAELTKLDWILFKQEQDARLWSGVGQKDENGKPEWIPGDHIHPYPERGFFEEFDHPSEGTDPNDWMGDESDGFRGNCPREMFSILSDVYREMPDEENPGFWKMELKFYYRCMTCEVSWYGDDPCFVCGETREKFKARMTLDKSSLAAYNLIVRNCRCPSCRHERGEITLEQMEEAFGVRRDQSVLRISENWRRLFAPGDLSEQLGLPRELLQTYSEEDVRMVNRMIEPMRTEFVDEMVVAAREANRALGGLGRQISAGYQRVFSPNRMRAMLGLDPVDFDGATMITVVRDENARFYVAPYEYPQRREAVFTNADFSTPLMDTLNGVSSRWSVLDEWRVGVDGTPEIRSNGIVIPSDYDTTPAVPLPEINDDIVNEALQRAITQRTYPTSAPSWSRRRPRYE